MRIDLHSHSTASDGLLRPTELVARAGRAGVDCLALTDHDTVAGVAEARAAGAAHDVEVVPGIELSTRHGDKRLHLLGLFVDPEHPRLLDYMRWRREARERRVERICAALRAAGVAIEADEVRAAAVDAAVLARPHVARVLVARGVVERFHEAFDVWLGSGKPGYVEDECLEFRDAAALVRDCGGVSSLAHPGCDKAFDLVPKLPELGVDAVEVFHPDHKPHQVKRLIGMCHKSKLLATGGSDFHRATPKVEDPGWVTLPPEWMSPLRALATTRAAR